MKSEGILLLSVLFICACAPATEEPAAVEEPDTSNLFDLGSIDALREEYVRLNNARDAAGIASLYTEDGVLLVENGGVESGREAIQAWFQMTYDIGPESDPPSQMHLTPEEIKAAGEWAFEWGAYTYQAGDAVKDRAHYLQILQLDPEGSWKYARTIWNSSEPAPEQ